MGTLHEDVFTFMTIFRWFFLRMKSVSNKRCRENQNTHFVSSDFFFFYKNRAAYESVQKCGEAREDSDNMAPARGILDK
jgi:hypothetical protein